MEKDPRYIEYLKTTETPTWFGYEMYCWELYKKEVELGLEKHKERNFEYISEINHLETFSFLQKFIKDSPKEMSRNETNDSMFNYSLMFMGTYNSLMGELSKDEMDKNSVKLFLDRTRERKLQIQNAKNIE